MPVSVFRRYTPPTCTLELQGTRSPLSNWSDRPIVKNIQFSLSIDGPQRHTTQKVTIRGDQVQLNDLHQAVSAYVQQTLTLSVDQFQFHFLGASTPAPTPTPTPWHDATRTGIAPPSAPQIQAPALRDRQPRATLYLSPQGLLQHQLHLGPFVRHNTPSVVVLTTTELFDLANALDAYYGELDSIPELNFSKHRLTPAPWLKAAAVAVFAVGVGTSMVRFIQLPTAQETGIQSQASRPSASVEETDSDRLSTQVRLPNIPAATEALSEEEDGDRPNNQAGEDQTDEGQTNEGQANEGQANDPRAESQNPALSSPDSSRRDEASQDEAAIALNELNDLDNPNNNAPPPSTRNTSPNAAPAETPPAAASPPPAAPAETPAPANGNPGWATSPTVPPPAPTDIPPELTAIPPITTIGEDILLDSSEMNLSVPPAPSTSSGDAESAARALNDQNAGIPTPSSSGWAPGTSPYPQLAEVQAYFANRWTPPPNLKQPLQYRLRLNPDGSLQQIIPLGESARTSTGVVGFPAAGEPFVSPFEGSGAPPIRLFLDANGQVRVFLESLD